MKTLRLTLLALIPLCAALSLAPSIAPEGGSHFDTLIRSGLLMTAIAGAFLFAATFLPAGRPEPPPKGTIQPSLTAYFVMAIVFIPSIASTIRLRDLWPYSPYSMYSEPRNRAPVPMITAYGVAAGREFDLRAIRYLEPFDPFRVWLCTFWAMGRGLPVEPIAKFYFDLYGRRRQAHGGPAIDSLRLYRETWDPARGSARTRELLVEVRP